MRSAVQPGRLAELLGAGCGLADRLAGPGASADLDHEVRMAAAGGAVEVRLVVRGPGRCAARLLDIRAGGDVVLHTMRGGRFETGYPPRAFRTSTLSLHPGLALPWATYPAGHEFGSELGRSSDAELPFFLLSDRRGEDGLWIAVGWSGWWRALFAREAEGVASRLTVWGPAHDVDLAAGEELELPRVLVGSWRGDGWTAVRRYLESVCPRRSAPWVVYNTYFNENLDISADRLLRNAEVAAEIGVEVVTLDAGWYDTPPGASLLEFGTAGIGTWTVDRRKFPGGLAPMSDAVRGMGMSFGIWFDPERAHRDSVVARRHPDWVLHAPGQEVGLLDFGNAEARAWILEVMSDAIAESSAGWLKWDFNPRDPRIFWPDGRRELAHLRGVYEVADALRARHPSLVLEMCAGGGNRLDVEMLSRSHSYWISDQTMSPDIARATLFGAARILPAQYRYLSLSPQTAGSGDDYPDAWFAGCMTGVFGLMDRLSEWSPATRRRAARFIEQHKAMRHLLDGEVRRFEDAGAATPFSAWDAIEFHDPSGGETLLVAMRQDSAVARRIFEGARQWDVALPAGGAAVERVAR